MPNFFQSLRAAVQALDSADAGASTAHLEQARQLGGEHYHGPIDRILRDVSRGDFLIAHGIAKAYLDSAATAAAAAAALAAPARNPWPMPKDPAIARAHAAAKVARMYLCAAQCGAFTDEVTDRIHTLANRAASQLDLRMPSWWQRVCELCDECETLFEEACNDMAEEADRIENPLKLSGQMREIKLNPASAWPFPAHDDNRGSDNDKQGD